MRTPYRVILLLGLLAIGGLMYAQPTMIPPTPTGLQASSEFRGMYSFVHLKWNAPMGAMYFRVYRSAEDSTNFKPLTVTNARGFDDFLVLPGHTYFYYVTSLSLGGPKVLESPPSDMVKITLGAGNPHPHGIVEGTITDSLTGAPLPFVQVLFYRFFPMSMRPSIPISAVPPGVWTDSVGHYSAVLDTGGYFIRAIPWRANASATQYIPEWYDNALTINKATRIDVADSTTFTADFALDRVAPVIKVQLSGTVRDTAGNPLNHALVTVLRSIQALSADAAMGSMQPEDATGIDIDDCGYMRGVVWSGYTDTLGKYQATVLSGKPYIVAATKKFYQPQFFNGKSSPSDADILVLSGDTTGIDFSLNLIPVINNSVAGVVKDSAGTGVQSRVLLIPLRPQPLSLSVRFINTDSTGAYLFSHVRGGKYIALAIPYDNFAPAFYKAGAFGVMHWKDADTINVSGTVAGIDIGVVPVSSNGVVTVHGRLLAGSSGPVGGANVFLLDAQGTMGGFGLTDATGGFSISMVSPGSYTLVADKQGYNSSSTQVPVSGSTYDVPVSDVTMSPDQTTGVDASIAMPSTFRLDQNYPNPFNPTTVIQYSLPQAATVTLRVFNILGQEVATLVNSVEPAGTYRATLDGRGLASGVYMYRLQAGSFTDVKHMVLLK